MRKKSPFRLLFVLLAVVLCGAAPIFSQENNVTAARWEYYTPGDDKVSFLLPRRPVVDRGGDECRGEAFADYAAYTNGVVYVVRVVKAVKPRQTCREKRRFGEANFLERAGFLRANYHDPTNFENNISAESVIKFSNGDRHLKLVNDYKNKRWFELSAIGADAADPAVNDFLDSLKTKAEAGVVIGEGAERALGDFSEKSVDVESVVTDDAGTERTVLRKNTIYRARTDEELPLRIGFKPRARYTEAARQAQVQGTVVLKTTFMPSGAIGSVSVVRGLPEGLTDEALKAARRLVFIPAQRGGYRVPVVKTIEYSFSIY